MEVFYDTHAHLDDPALLAELPALLERAAVAGVGRIVCVGTDLESSETAIRLSEQHPNIYAVAGWHPNHVLDAPEDIRPQLRAMARHPRVVALGETGLDHYRMPPKAEGPEVAERFKRRQIELFEQHLEVAAETGLNCVVHQRGDVLDATLEHLRPYAGRVRAVFHCFPGGLDGLRRILDMGCLVSFTGILTFKNGADVRAALDATPMDAFMLETDCPYLAPMPHRGRRCEPAHLIETARVAAEVKGCSLDVLAATTGATARAFFKGME